MSNLLKDTTATLNELLRMHDLNQELLETLSVTMMWVKDYADKHNIPLPRESSYTSLINKAQTLIEELASSDEKKQGQQSDEEVTAPVNTMYIWRSVLLIFLMLMKRIIGFLTIFTAILASLLPLASFFVRSACCKLHSPFLTISPSEPYVGQKVLVEASIYLSACPCYAARDLQASLFLPDEASLVSGENPTYIGNMSNYDSRIVNWTIMYTSRSYASLLVEVSGYRADMGEPIQEYGSLDVQVLAHDVAVVDIIPSTNEVNESDLVDIAVVIQNNGDFIETFNVTAYANTTIIQNQTVSNLAPTAQATLAFIWNTTGVSCGNYTIKAETSIVPEETHIADNVKVNGIVSVAPEFPSFLILPLFMTITFIAVIAYRRRYNI